RRLSHRLSRPLAVAAVTAAEGTGEDTAAVMPAATVAGTVAATLADTVADTLSVAAPTMSAPSMALSQRCATSAGSAAFITSRISVAAFGARPCMPITAIIVAGVGFPAAGAM